MAKIELGSTYLGDSLDNFIVFQNDSFIRPTVIFRFDGGNFNSGSFSVIDTFKDDGYSKVISFGTGSVISETSFTYFPSNMSMTMISMIECLKLNSIFSEPMVVTVSGVECVRCYIDTSTRYEITSSNAALTVMGSYASWTPKEPTKFVLVEAVNGNQISLEKYSMGGDVSFNVTSPFEHSSYKEPLSVSLFGYKVDGGVVESLPISNSSVYVLPTSLSKFNDINLDDYAAYGSNFLTNMTVREYNKGEMVGLSILGAPLTIRKKYYTVSGRYLGMDEVFVRREKYDGRIDYYFQLDIDGIENSTNNDVGYVDVFGMYQNDEMRTPVRFIVNPICKQNNVLFFVNSLGGIDSFNFLGDGQDSYKIEENKTHLTNPVAPWGIVKEIEKTSSKVMRLEHKVLSVMVDRDVAEWLMEIGKSRYVFKFDGSTFERVVVISMTNTLKDDGESVEITLTYRDGDNSLAL